MASQIFRCHPHLGLKDNKENFVFNVSIDWKPVEMFLNVKRYMGVTGNIYLYMTCINLLSKRMFFVGVKSLNSLELCHLSLCGPSLFVLVWN